MDEAQINAIVDEILAKLTRPLHKHESVVFGLSSDGVTYRILMNATGGWPYRVGTVPGKHNAQRIVAALQETIAAAKRLKEATNDSRPGT